ncbi:nucleotidyltransferase family protein [Dyadobacter psychrotolerans]|uniref:Nucleotidyltransferase domain-containing protein n=1 Tax=Dyadobacter psychrotolerans TaxID=2541721 RepID=A0A4R5DI82_9BACT|nr:nucleotidyltransferase domain-containing protein [Dyadobacter psychrotolerans]TDE13812.1 nucleotidyltransferase domain-containing protein [Dyadobacter psychrotolerans]
MFGLQETDILAIQHALENYPGVKEAYIFGSRAKGNYRKGSDVDIALKGDNISFSHILTIAGYLNEDTMMPYHFDVLDYDAIQNQQLTEHIDRAGILFYKKQ